MEPSYSLVSPDRGSSQPDSVEYDGDCSEYMSFLNIWADTEENDKIEKKQCCTQQRRQWKRALRRASLRGNLAEAERLLATQCSCVSHEADARTAKERALLDACVYGHRDLLRLLLAHGVHVDAQLGWNFTGLLYAAARNHVQCLEVLLDHGADLHHVDTCHSTALHWAADKGAAECVRVLLDRGANFTTRHEHGHTPLYSAIKGHSSLHIPSPYFPAKPNGSIDYLQCVKLLCHYEYISCIPEEEINQSFLIAIEMGCVEIVQYLLNEKIVDLSYKSSEGDNALHVATTNSKVECIRVLVKAGFDVNCRDNKGRTALHLVYTAVCARELILLGADVLAQDDNGWTVVHYAAEGGRLELLRFLVDTGCGDTVTTNEGEIALHLSAKRNTLACMTMLLEMGADMNATTAEGKTPLHCAAQGWSTSCMEKLVSEGADVFARDSQGWTALHWAAREGWIEGCRYLLARGLDVEVRTAAGQTPLHVAVREGNARCVEELLRLHAPVNARDEQGRTPLHVAASGSDEHVAHVLLLGGADRRARDAQGLAPGDVALAPAMRRLIRSWAIGA